MSTKQTKQGSDKLNWGILKELCANARVPAAEIGRRVGLSSSAVTERINKLEESGFIKGHHSQIDFDQAGLTIQAFITFKAKSPMKSELLKMLDSMPQVMEWHSITGPSCLIMRVAVATRKELESTIESLVEHGETSTSLILSSSSYNKQYERLFA